MSDVALLTEIANAVSKLRRVKPHVPFFELAAHTVPTKWGLYRGLLHNAPGDNIRWRIKKRFRRFQHLTSPTTTTTHLVFGYKVLDMCLLAKAGDTHAQAVLARYDRFLAFKRLKGYWSTLYHKEAQWIERLRNRPIMTGGYLQASFYNPPLPDLKPQPQHISGMIVSRQRARSKRLVEHATLVSWQEDMQHETAFEEALAEEHPLERIFSGSLAREWDRTLTEHIQYIRECLRHDHVRSEMKFTPEMVETIREARREKIANKTRERERMRRGERVSATFARSRQRPPARVSQNLTPDERFIDAVARLPGEVGFVGAVKRARGQRLRDNKTWMLEDGLPEDQARLEEQERIVHEANHRKRYAWLHDKSLNKTT